MLITIFVYYIFMTFLCFCKIHVYWLNLKIDPGAISDDFNMSSSFILLSLIPPTYFDDNLYIWPTKSQVAHSFSIWLIKILFSYSATARDCSIFLRWLSGIIWSLNTMYLYYLRIFFVICESSTDLCGFDEKVSRFLAAWYWGLVIVFDL